jgi:hypothetical protein
MISKLLEISCLVKKVWSRYSDWWDGIKDKGARNLPLSCSAESAEALEGDLFQRRGVLAHKGIEKDAQEAEVQSLVRTSTSGKILGKISKNDLKKATWRELNRRNPQNLPNEGQSSPLPPHRPSREAYS